MRRCAPAAERNREPIALVLQEVLPARGTALEVASGTGQHVAHFAGRFGGLRWIPSDPSEAARESIAAWTAGLDNVEIPLNLDVRDRPWPVPALTAALAINMVHISPWDATQGLIAGAAEHLSADGVLFLYGPYRRGGRHTAASNEAFDADLRARDPAWGVRDLEEVQALAARHGLAHERTVPMPANNFSVVFRRVAAPP